MHAGEYGCARLGDEFGRARLGDEYGRARPGEETNVSLEKVDLIFNRSFGGASLTAAAQAQEGHLTEQEPTSGVLDEGALEALAVIKIREHRRQIEADQLVYEEWVRASEDATVSAMVLQTMQDEYLARQAKADMLQEELSALLDTLGYIPHVPETDPEDGIERGSE